MIQYMNMNSHTHLPVLRLAGRVRVCAGAAWGAGRIGMRACDRTSARAVSTAFSRLLASCDKISNIEIHGIYVRYV